MGAHEGGAVTRPKLSVRILDLVLAHNLCFSWISYVTGLILVMLFAAVSISTGELKPRGTFIAESAVTLQIMDSIYSESDAKIAMQIQRDAKAANFSRAADLVAHITAVCHNLTLTAEIQQAKSAAGAVVDTLICTVPARMFAEGNEAIVLGSQLVQSDDSYAASPSAAFLLSLAHTLTRVQWLAKDVLVVLTVNNGPGSMSNFLQAYDASPASIGRVIPLKHHSGPIRGALVVDFPTTGAVDRLLLQPHTGDGRVPELDFFTLVANAMRAQVHLWDASSSIAHGWLYHRRNAALEYMQRDGGWIVQVLAPAYSVAFPGNRLHQIQVAQYTERLFDLVASVLLTLFSSAECQHCDFSNRNYPAMTIKGLSTTHVEDIAEETRWIAAHGSAFEKVVKALSNADERLHAGATAYVLMGANYFLGMNEYAISIGVFLIPTLLMTVKSMPQLVYVPTHLAITCAVAALLLVSSCYSAAFTSMLIAPVVVIRMTGRPVDNSAFLLWQVFGFSQFCLMYSHGTACILLCIVCTPILLLTSAAISTKHRWLRSAVQLVLYIIAACSQYAVSSTTDSCSTFAHFGRLTTAKMSQWLVVLLWLISATI